MKFRLLTLTLCLISLRALSVRAEFVVGDDFTDPARDIVNWGESDPVSQGAAWVEANGALNLVVSDATSGQTVRTWRARSPSFTNNWEVSAELKLSDVDILDEGGVSLIVTVGDALNPDNNLRIAFTSLATFEEIFRQVNVEARNEGVLAGSLSRASSAGVEKILIRYDAHSRMLSAGTLDSSSHFSAIGLWNCILWNMNGGSPFEVEIEGDAFGATTALGQATVDNLRIAEAAPRALGPFPGEDNFDDNDRSESKWGPLDSTIGLGVLEEVNGGLRFSTESGGAGEQDLAARLWFPGVADFASSWSAQVDVVLPSLDLAQPGNEVEVGLVVLDVLDPGDRATITLNLQNQQASTVRHYSSSVLRDGAEFPDFDVVQPTMSQSVALRARWDAAVRRLYLEYDDNGSIGGYQWASLTNYALDSGEVSWKLSSSSRFQVGVFGGSYLGTPVPMTANVRFDNFVTTGETVMVPSIVLGPVERTGNKLKLVWQGGKGPYQLQAQSVISGSAWINVGSQTNSKESIVDIVGSATFFRILDVGQ